MLRIYQALKSLCKCEHLKALFIALTKKSMIFLPASPLIKITYHLSLLNWDGYGNRRRRATCFVRLRGLASSTTTRSPPVHHPCLPRILPIGVYVPYHPFLSFAFMVLNNKVPCLLENDIMTLVMSGAISHPNQNGGLICLGVKRTLYLLLISSNIF